TTSSGSRWRCWATTPSRSAARLTSSTSDRSRSRSSRTATRSWTACPNPTGPPSWPRSPSIRSPPSPPRWSGSTGSERKCSASGSPTGATGPTNEDSAASVGTTCTTGSPGRSDAGSTPTATSSRTRTAERSRTPPGHRSPVSIVWATSATAGIRSPKRGRPRNGRSFTPGRRTCKDSLPHGGRGVCDGEVMGELGKVLGDRGGSRREETVLAHRRAGGRGLARVRHHGVEAHLRARGAFRIDQVVPDEQGPVDRDAHLAQEEEKSLGGGLHRSGGAAASQVLEIGREFRSNERLASEELRASGEETDAETAQGENLQ